MGQEIFYVKHGRDTNLNGTLAEYGRYELMYGGIDSDGIVVRADDMTPLMAAVAQRHAIEVSCPVVLREFYLLPNEDRRLFGGIDTNMSPASEAFASAQITSESRTSAQSVSLTVSLPAGAKTVRLAFTNDFYDETEGDRNLYLDALVVRDTSGSTVSRIELENLPPQANPDCNHARIHDFALHCSGALNVEVSIPAHGEYRIEVIAYQEASGNEPAKLEIAVESDGGSSRGARAIKSKLAELHQVLFGVTVPEDSPDIETSYQFFREAWERKRGTEGSHFDKAHCSINDVLYFEGIFDDSWGYNKWGNSEINDRAWDLLDQVDRSDPFHVARTWVVTLAYLLSDYRYLYF